MLSHLSYRDESAPSVRRQRSEPSVLRLLLGATLATTDAVRSASALPSSLAPLLTRELVSGASGVRRLPALPRDLAHLGAIHRRESPWTPRLRAHFFFPFAVLPSSPFGCSSHGSGSDEASAFVLLASDAARRRSESDERDEVDIARFVSM